ncbi:protease inhibitor I42 family protein [Caulobacter sp. ErkDOM-YI]|uniref:protease inhibitor I42 family protein n=1 Tax=unclassified Caulobacter TaxID=2648921 RepID=UPI003AF6893B
MKRLVSSALAASLGLGLILMVGCASAPPPPPGPLTVSDAGPVVLAPGQVLRIELPLSAGTGYSWRLDREADGTVLSGGSSQTTDAALPGGAIMTIFTYQASARGRAELSFTLKRPWMPDTASDTRRVFQVLVK